jgi:tRNA-specific 2-thiouridylase
LKQEQLQNIILPLGGYTKAQIREIAKENGLDVAEKPDSQDFYDGDYNELLGIEEKEGNIVDLDGKVLGKHKGIWNYTIGQRKGIGVSSTEPLYVLKLNKDTNEVVIGPADKTFKKSLVAGNLNWIGIESLAGEMKAQAKIRSTQQPTEVTLRPDGELVNVEFDELQKSIAIGQSVVFYDGDIVLGGGVIQG